MNRSARRSRVHIGLAYLSEVTADVLQEAYDGQEGPLLVEDIKRRAAFPDTPRINQVVRGVLNLMLQDGVVEVADDPDGFQVWRLVEV